MLNICKYIILSLHPLLLTLYVSLLLIFSRSNISLLTLQGKFFIVSLILVFALLIPTGIYLLTNKWVKLKTKITQRVVREIGYAISLLLGYGILQKLIPYSEIKLILLVCAMLWLFIAMIHTCYNISKHMVFMSFLIATTYLSSQYLALLIHFDTTILITIEILFTGIVGSALIGHNKNNPAQVYTGLSLGILLLYITLYLF